MPKKTGTIWSVRLKRELSSLRSENNQSRILSSTLPPFVSITEHIIDLEKGIFKIIFAVELEVPKVNETAEQESQKVLSETEQIAEEEKDIELKEKDIEEEEADVEEEEGDVEGEKGNVKGEETYTNREEGDTEEGVTDSCNETPAKAIVELDASMMAGPESAEETSHNNYPFQKPRAVLIEGACYFPPGSPIEDGASVEVDCDWTPSLHLADAILNVSLRIRESIRRGDITGLISP